MEEKANLRLKEQFADAVKQYETEICSLDFNTSNTINANAQQINGANLPGFGGILSAFH